MPGQLKQRSAVKQNHASSQGQQAQDRKAGECDDREDELEAAPQEEGDNDGDAGGADDGTAAQPTTSSKPATPPGKTKQADATSADAPTVDATPPDTGSPSANGNGNGNGRQRSLTRPDRPPPSEGGLMRANGRFRSQGCDLSPQSLLCSRPCWSRAPAALPQSSLKVERRAALEAAVVREMNRVRATHGLQPLRAAPSLRAAARGHSLSMLELGYFGHDSADGTAFSDRIKRHYSNRGWRTWSVGEALLASQGKTRRRNRDRRSLARLSPAPRDHPVAHLARRRHRSALRPDRPARVRRRGDDRRDSRLRHAGGEDRARPLAAAVTAAARYAASVWIGVWPGSISVAKPRSQVTTT